MAVREPPKLSRRIVIEKFAAASSLIPLAGIMANLLTTGRAAASNQSTSEHVVYVSKKTGILQLKEPSDSFTTQERDLIISGVMGEISVILGMAPNSDAVNVAQNMIALRADHPSRDITALGSLIYFANNPTKSFHIVATRATVADAINRGLEQPEISALSADITIGIHSVYRKPVQSKNSRCLPHSSIADSTKKSGIALRGIDGVRQGNRLSAQTES